MKPDCIPNIGPLERRRRLRTGFVSFACAIAVATVLLASDASRAWRILLFLPVLLSAFAFLQVRARTCVVLAAKGLRNLDAGNESIASNAELATVKAQARRVNVEACLVAAAVTAAVWALP